MATRTTLQKQIDRLFNKLEAMEKEFDALHEKKVAAVKARRFIEADRIIDRLHEMQDAYWEVHARYCTLIDEFEAMA